MADRPGASDPAEIVRVLADHHVDHVLVGGVDARPHGSPTLTEDVDLTPEPSPANLGRLAAALAALDARMAAPDVDGGPVVPLDAETFSSPVMTFATRAGQVDVVRERTGLGGHAAVAAGAAPGDDVGTWPRASSAGEAGIRTHPRHHPSPLGSAGHPARKERACRC